jgi:thymidine kinase
MFLEEFPGCGKRQGWIEVICGSMFSGKTEELIRRMRRAQFANQRLMIFKPKVDDRYATEEVVSHKGERIPAMAVSSSIEILERISDEQVIGIDEAQFFDEDLPEVCNTLSGRGVRIICAGLDMDYMGQPFGPIPQLMAVAEYVTKVHAICMSCGNLAQFSFRKTNYDQKVMLGAKEEYEPLCRHCYNTKQQGHT